MGTLETVKMSSRGQIVIPEEMRSELGLKEGSKLVLIREDNKIILESEGEFMKMLSQDKERLGWYMLAQKSLAKVWDNPKDEAASKWYEEQIRKGAYDESKKK